jgi:ubiquinone/menaquinone biosynthesis C-methylase UbiE
MTTKRREPEKGLTAWQPSLENKVCEYIKKYSSKEFTVLDAGCGNGIYANYAKRFNKNVYCADIKQKKIDEQPGDYVQASIGKLPFKDDSFDFIYCLSVLEFVEHDEAAIKEFHRVLKPKGNLLLTVPTVISPFSLIRKWELLFGVYTLPEFNVKNYHYYSRKRIGLMTSDKFRLLEISGYGLNFLPRFISFLYRLADKETRISRLKLYRIAPPIKNADNHYATSENGRNTKKERPLHQYLKNKLGFLNDLSYHYITALRKEG